MRESERERKKERKKERDRGKKREGGREGERQTRDRGKEREGGKEGERHNHYCSSAQHTEEAGGGTCSSRARLVICVTNKTPVGNAGAFL